MFQEVVPCSCSQVLVGNMEGKAFKNYEHDTNWTSCSIECTGTVSASQSQLWINKFPSSQYYQRRPYLRFTSIGSGP